MSRYLDGSRIVYWDNSNGNLTVPGRLAASSIIGDYSSSNVNALTVSTGRLIYRPDRIALGFNSGVVNQAAGSVAIGVGAASTNQQIASVAIGSNAGNLNQSNFAIAIGSLAGSNAQRPGSIAIGTNAAIGGGGIAAIAIGSNAGCNSQSTDSLAIGTDSGRLQENFAIAIGSAAGAVGTQRTNAIAIGRQSGNINQSNFAIAIGNLAGQSNQQEYTIAIGQSAGLSTQGAFAVAIGEGTGSLSQGAGATAVGVESGQSNQGIDATAVGKYAGKFGQGRNAIGVGLSAGFNNQGCNAIAIGNSAGSNAQGNHAIAIGPNAGVTSQAANSIILNASSTTLNAPNTGFFVNPVRYDGSASLGTNMIYNPTTKEVQYSDILSTTTVRAGTIVAGTLTYSQSAVETLSSMKLFTSSIVAEGNVSTTSLQANNALTTSTIGRSIYATNDIRSADGVYGVRGDFTGALAARGLSSLAISTGTITAGMITVTNTSTVTISTTTVNANDVNAMNLSSQQINTSSIYAAGNVSTVALQTSNLIVNNPTLAIGLNAGTVGQYTSAIAIGCNAGNSNQAPGAVAIGVNAGQSGQIDNAIAIGYWAGRYDQDDTGIAIGYQAALSNQGYSAVAIGWKAGQSNQGNDAVAIGDVAGQINQGVYAVSLGFGAGYSNQMFSAVAIGNSAGLQNQQASAVSIGNSAGYQNQQASAISIGNSAGYLNQDSNAVALGVEAGQDSQGFRSIAIGNEAGKAYQSQDGIAIGYRAGRFQQKTNAIAIGREAGDASQGSNAIAIGYKAGFSGQYPSSIIINADPSGLDNNTVSGLFINPVRSNAIDSGILHYNSTTKEITYSDDILKVKQIQVSSVIGFSPITFGDAAIFNSTIVGPSVSTISINVGTLNATNLSYAQSAVIALSSQQINTSSIFAEGNISTVAVQANTITTTSTIARGIHASNDIRSASGLYGATLNTTGAVTAGSVSTITFDADRINARLITVTNTSTLMISTTTVQANLVSSVTINVGTLNATNLSYAQASVVALSSQQVFTSSIYAAGNVSTVALQANTILATNIIGTTGTISSLTMNEAIVNNAYFGNNSRHTIQYFTYKSNSSVLITIPGSKSTNTGRVILKVIVLKGAQNGSLYGKTYYEGDATSYSSITPFRFTKVETNRSSALVNATYDASSSTNNTILIEVDAGVTAETTDVLVVVEAFSMYGSFGNGSLTITGNTILPSTIGSGSSVVNYGSTTLYVNNAILSTITTSNMNVNQISSGVVNTSLITASNLSTSLISTNNIQANFISSFTMNVGNLNATNLTYAQASVVALSSQQLFTSSIYAAGNVSTVALQANIVLATSTLATSTIAKSLFASNDIRAASNMFATAINTTNATISSIAANTVQVSQAYFGGISPINSRSNGHTIQYFGFTNDSPMEIHIPHDNPNLNNNTVHIEITVVFGKTDSTGWGTYKLYGSANTASSRRQFNILQRQTFIGPNGGSIALDAYLDHASPLTGANGEVEVYIDLADTNTNTGYVIVELLSENGIFQRGFTTTSAFTAISSIGLASTAIVELAGSTYINGLLSSQTMSAGSGSISSILANSIVTNSTIARGIFASNDIRSAGGLYGVSLTTTGAVTAGSVSTITFDADRINARLITVTNTSTLVVSTTTVRANTVSTLTLEAGLVNGITVTGRNGTDSLAIGQNAGVNQGFSAIAIGPYAAGYNVQGDQTIALGYEAGLTVQSSFAIAIGTSSGETQQIGAIALGKEAGKTQGIGAIDIGYVDFGITQGKGAVRIGLQEATGVSVIQSNYAVSIGPNAGSFSQHPDSIILNASSQNIATTASGLFINPVRSNAVGSGILHYDSTTKEITYSDDILKVKQIQVSSFIGFSPINFGEAAIFNSTLVAPVVSTTTINVGTLNATNLTYAQSATVALSSQQLFTSSIYAAGNISTVALQANTVTTTSTIARGIHASNDIRSASGLYGATLNTTGAVTAGSVSTITFDADRINARLITVTNTSTLVVSTTTVQANLVSSVTINVGTLNATNLSYAQASVVALSSQQLFTSSIYAAGNISTVAFQTSNLRVNSANIAIGQSAGLISQQTNAVAIGFGAGSNTQNTDAVAIGINAGSNNQGTWSVAIGSYAGNSSQGSNAVAIGHFAGQDQARETVAIGWHAGSQQQQVGAVAIGDNAGRYFQQNRGIAIGSNAGFSTQGVVAVAIGVNTAISSQGSFAVAIGTETAQMNQGQFAVAIGAYAGLSSQGAFSVAIGEGAGRDAQQGGVAIGTETAFTNQGLDATAIGTYAGRVNQGMRSIAIGRNAGFSTQGAYSVAIGDFAGFSTQGAYAVAIGNLAGSNVQNASSIVINASPTALDNRSVSGLFINPIRSNAIDSGILHYNSTTKEITYSDDILKVKQIQVSSFIGFSPISFGDAVIFNSTVTGSNISTISLNVGTLNATNLSYAQASVVALSSQQLLTSSIYAAGNVSTAALQANTIIASSTITNSLFSSNDIRTAVDFFGQDTFMTLSTVAANLFASGTVRAGTNVFATQSTIANSVFASNDIRGAGGLFGASGSISGTLTANTLTGTLGNISSLAAAQIALSNSYFGQASNHTIQYYSYTNALNTNNSYEISIPYTKSAGIFSPLYAKVTMIGIKGDGSDNVYSIWEATGNWYDTANQFLIGRAITNDPTTHRINIVGVPNAGFLTNTVRISVYTGAGTAVRTHKTNIIVELFAADGTFFNGALTSLGVSTITTSPVTGNTNQFGGSVNVNGGFSSQTVLTSSIVAQDISTINFNANTINARVITVTNTSTLVVSTTTVQANLVSSATINVGTLNATNLSYAQASVVALSSQQLFTSSIYAAGNISTVALQANTVTTTSTIANVTIVNSNLGVGTSIPRRALDVAGNVAFGVSSRMQFLSGLSAGEKGITFNYDPTSNLGYIQSEWQGNFNTPLAFNANGGNVGIGTNAPGQALDVNGAVAGRSVSTISVSSATVLTSSIFAAGNISSVALQANTIIARSTITNSLFSSNDIRTTADFFGQDTFMTLSTAATSLFASDTVRAGTNVFATQSTIANSVFASNDIRGAGGLFGASGSIAGTLTANTLSSITLNGGVITGTTGTISSLTASQMNLSNAYFGNAGRHTIQYFNYTNNNPVRIRIPQTKGDNFDSLNLKVTITQGAGNSSLNDVTVYEGDAFSWNALVNFAIKKRESSTNRPILNATYDCATSSTAPTVILDINAGSAAGNSDTTVVRVMVELYAKQGVFYNGTLAVHDATSTITATPISTNHRFDYGVSQLFVGNTTQSTVTTSSINVNSISSGRIVSDSINARVITVTNTSTILVSTTTVQANTVSTLTLNVGLINDLTVTGRNSIGAVAIGSSAAVIGQGAGAIAIGAGAGYSNQGAFAVAIGANAGDTNQSPSSIVINGSPETLTSIASGLFINPVRSNAIDSGILHYNSTTKEITYSDDILKVKQIQVSSFIGFSPVSFNEAAIFRSSLVATNISTTTISVSSLQTNGMLNDQIYGSFGSFYRQLTSASNVDYSGVAVNSNGQYIVLAPTTNGAVRYSSDFGRTFSTLSVTSSFTNAAISGDGSQIALATQNSIIVSRNRGASWSASTLTSSAGKISMSKDGKYILASAALGRTVISYDYGSNWSTLGGLSTLVNAHWYIDNDMSYDGRYMAVATYAGGIAFTSNYGSTWYSNTAAGSNAWYSVAFSGDGSIVYAGRSGGGGGVYKSVNYGSNFSATSLGSTDDWNNIVCSSNGSNVLIGVGNALNRVYRSSDAMATNSQITGYTTINQATMDYSGEFQYFINSATNTVHGTASTIVSSIVNTTGRFMGIRNTNPVCELDVGGDINIASNNSYKINNTTALSASNFIFAHGYVDSNGSLLSGYNATTSLSVNTFTVTFAQPKITSNYTATVSINAATGAPVSCASANVFNKTSNGFQVAFNYFDELGGTVVNYNYAFSFIVI